MNAYSPRSARTLVGSMTVALLASSTALTSPASAEPPERESFSDSFSVVVEDFCGVTGLDVRNEGTFSGRFLLTRKGAERTAYGMQHTVLEQTSTNVATGDSVTQTDRTTEKDLRVTDNGDGTVTILVLATGASTVSGTDGKVLARNPGQVRYEVLIDDGGTPSDVSDDEFLEFLGFVKESTGRNDDYCSAIVAEIG